MAVSVTMISTAIFILTFAVILVNPILRMIGSMLAAMQANKSAILIIQQQADTDDNVDSDDDFMMTLLHRAH